MAEQVHFTVILDKEMRDELDKAAQRVERNSSSLVRILIKNYLEEQNAGLQRR
jgi:metal-responsive CopG/Arc/MetJ family transcriptional regulator